MALFGNTYGALGGMAAANEVAGQQQGYDFVENMKDKSINRKILQEKWALESEKRMNDIQQQHRKMFAQDQLIAQKGGDIPENLKYMNSKIQKLEKENKSNIKDFFGNLFTRFLGSDRPDDELVSINAALDQHPERKAGVGLKGPLEPVSKDSPYDRKEVANYLMKTNKAFTKADKKTQDAMVDKAIDSRTFVKSAGTVMDAKDLAVGMGSMASMPADVKAKTVGKKVGKEPKKPSAGDVPIIAQAYGDPTVGKTQTGSDSFNPDQFLARLKEKEGFRSKPYKDGDGYSVGYGHFIKPGEEHLMRGVTKEQAEQLLEQDAKSHVQQLVAKEPWVKELPVSTQQAVADMAYNMGPGWMDKLPTTKKLLQQGDYEGAANSILNTKYASQVGNRADENASLIANNPQYASSGTSSMAPQTGTTAGDWRNRPYNRASGNDLESIYMQMAGFQDNRPALARNLDYISNQLGPNASMGEVVDVYQDIMTRKGAGGSSASYPSYEYAKADIANNMYQKYGEDWRNNHEAMKEYNYDMERARSRFLYGGASESSNRRDESTIANGMADWSNFKTNGNPNKAVVNPYLKSEQLRILNKDSENKKLYTVAANKDMVGKSTDKLLGQLKDMEKAGQLNFGIMKNIMQVGAEFLDPNFTGDEETILANSGIRAEYHKIMSEWLRALSGMAASDKEVVRVRLQTGLNEWKDPKVAIAGLESFNSSIKRDVRMIGDALGQAGYSEVGKQFYKNTSGKRTIGRQAAPNSPTMPSSTVNEKEKFIEVNSEKVFLQKPKTKFRKDNCIYYNFGEGKIGKECN